MSILQSFDLSGKKAIVTGGGRGLGKAIAEGLCQAGASVVLVGSSDSVFSTAKEFNKKGYIAYPIKGNLENADMVTEIFTQSLAKLDGKIDILVNNAGIIRRHKCEEFPLEDWNAVMQVNLNAVFILCKLTGREMLKQGYGKIINLALVWRLDVHHRAYVAQLELREQSATHECEIKEKLLQSHM